MASESSIGRIGSAAVGLAALVAAAAAVNAQQVQQVAYADTNLAEYGVPNFEKMTPVSTRYVDRTAVLPGNETRIDAYRVGKGFVATYTANDRLYSIGFDADGRRPLDHGFMDKTGLGVFEPYPVDRQISVPNWVYIDSKTLK